MTTAPSALPSPATASRPRWGRVLLQLALVAVLWPSLMVYPGAPEVNLDASWQLLLIHAFGQGWHFGRELVFTWGPWGFLNGHYHLGESGAVAKLAWETGGRLVLAFAVVRLVASLVVWRQVAFVAGLALVGWLFVDAAFYLLIALLVVAGLLRPGVPLAERVAWALLLAFLSCFKFTYLVCAVGGVAVATAASVLRGDRWSAAGIGATYPVGFLLAWIAARQHPDNIWPYVVRSLEMTAGYGDAMAAEEPTPVFLWGAALLLAGCLQLILSARRNPDRVVGWSTALFLGGLWFVVWKSSFTRADGHVFGFFIFAGLAGWLLPGLCDGARRPRWPDLSAIAALCGIAAFEADLVARIPEVGVARIAANYAALPKIPRMPAGWEAAWQDAKRNHHLPRIREAVGRARVDVANHEQAIALFNDLNFVPRPVFQGYSAYTPRLAWRNLRHYRTPASAPEFVLWKHATIDGRFPSLDDAGLVAEIARGYVPVLEENGYLLLRKVTPLPPAPLARRLVLEQAVGFDQDVALPVAGPHPLWLQVELPLSKLGRLRALLYKPPMPFLVTTDAGGAERTWRLLSRVAADGFLLDPVLETQSDFAAYVRGYGSLGIRSIRVTAPPAQREYFATIWRQPVVRLFELPETTLKLQGRYAALVQAGIFGAEPDSIESVHAIESFPTSAGPVLQVHAPGEVLFPVEPGAREFLGHFGIRDGAHVAAAPTDGVHFTLEAIEPDGTRRLLWQRTLDPAREPGDRGPQALRAELPNTPGLRLSLRALPGRTNESDWSYFGGLRFAPSLQR